MTISMIKKDYHSHRNMRTLFRKGMDSTFDFEATRIPQIKQNKGLACRNKPEQIHMIEIYPIPYHASVGKIFQELLEFPPINSRNFLVMQSGVGDTGETIYLTQTNNTYIQVVSICQHITKKPLGIVYLNLRKASVIRAMAILPNSRPSTRWRRGYLTNNCIKEIFDVGKTQVFQNCNDKIVTTTPRSSTPRDTATTPKCQEAPRTMFSSTNHRNVSMIPA